MDYCFDYEKNLKLLKTRGICFEQIISLIEQGYILDIVEHPNKDKYPNQQIYIVNISNYCYLVPFTKNGDEIFLKTIIPSRKATKKYLIETKKDKNNA